MSSAPDAAGARAYLESLRWPGGNVVCPHCRKPGECGRVTAGEAAGTRPGLWHCRRCGRQFTVTVGTLFEDSKLPLETWVQALRLLCERPDGATARQLERELQITYKSARQLLKKVQYALEQPPLRQEWERHHPHGKSKTRSTLSDSAGDGRRSPAADHSGAEKSAGDRTRR